MKSAKRKDEKPISGNFRTRKRDGRELEKKGFWLDAERAHAFEVWCVTQRRDMSEVVDELIAGLLAKKR